MGLFTHDCSLPSPGLSSRSWTCHCGQTWQIQRLRPVQETAHGTAIATASKGKKR